MLQTILGCAVRAKNDFLADPIVNTVRLRLDGPVSVDIAVALVGPSDVHGEEGATPYI